MHTADPTASEAQLLLRRWKHYKSPGVFQIPAELIQTGGETLRSEIHKLSKLIWNKDELRYQSKKSIGVHIRKNKTDCSNYRGISLLLTSYNILSNILLSRLIPYADEIIGHHQCGFRRNRSKTDQIFCIRQILEDNISVPQLFSGFKKA
jgi:hypothetical protein